MAPAWPPTGTSSGLQLPQHEGGSEGTNEPSNLVPMGIHWPSVCWDPNAGRDYLGNVSAGFPTFTPPFHKFAAVPVGGQAGA